jgi:hypothetical protein
VFAPCVGLKRLADELETTFVGSESDGIERDREPFLDAAVVGVGGDEVVAVVVVAEREFDEFHGSPNGRSGGNARSRRSPRRVRRGCR